MQINQTQRIVLSFLFCFLIANIGYAQKTLTSEEAFVQHQELPKTLKSLDKEKYLVQSFSVHFQRMDLALKIKNRHVYVLSYYHNTGYQFRILGRHRESLNIYKAFFAYYDANESLFSSELKQEYLKKRSFDYRGMAEAYQKLSLLDSANLEHQINLKFTDTMTNIYKPAAINDYGMFLYGGMKNNDLALTNFKEAYTLTKKYFPEHFLLGSICDNMAKIYFEKGEMETAKTLYKDNFEFYQKSLNETYKVVDVYLLVKTGSKIVDIEIKQGNLKQAEYAYTELLNVYNNYNQPPYNKEETKLEFLKAKQQFLATTQKKDMAYVVLKEVNRLSDSLNQATSSKSNQDLTIMNEIILNRYRNSFKIEKAQKETVIRSQRLKLWVVTLTSSLVLLLLVSLFLRRRQYLIIAKNKQQLAEQSLEFSALKNMKLNAEIESKKRDLSDFAINLTQSQEWAKGLADKIESIKTLGNKEQQLQLDSLEQDIQNKITVDSDTKEFYERLDKLSDAFYRELGSRFTKLSKNEVRLCSLIRLKMDSRSIATMQNITLSSLNTSRYRLRKKLNLSEDVDLDNFIQNI